MNRLPDDGWWLQELSELFSGCNIMVSYKSKFVMVTIIGCNGYLNAKLLQWLRKAVSGCNG